MQKRKNMVYHKSMPKKTLFLIIGLVVITVILFIIALQTGKNQPQGTDQVKIQATPTPDVAHTVLAMSPNPIQVASGRTGSVDVTIDPSDNRVTAVQLELLYDPTVISNVKVVPGPLFPNAAVLIDDNNPTEGTYTFAYGIQPSQEPVISQGVAATITFTARGALGKQAQILLQAESLVTARGVPNSVLKTGTGTTVVISSPANATTTQTTPAGTRVQASPTATQ